MTLDTADPRAEDVPIPEDNEVLMLRAKAKEGKGAKELSPKTIDKKERKAFGQGDAKDLAAWRDKEAYEELTDEESRSTVMSEGQGHSHGAPRAR